MTGRLSGKVVAITGAARGQGRAHAIRCAEEGASLILMDLCEQIESNLYPLATRDDFDITLKEVDQRGAKAVDIIADVRERSSIRAAIDTGLAAFGRLDGVVANAGICPMGSESGPEAFIDAVDVDFVGVMNTVAATVSHLKGDGGSIVITGSTAAMMKGSVDNPALGHGGAGYGYAKRALLDYSETLSDQLGKYSIRVNTMHPTNCNTHLLHNREVYNVFRPDLENPTRDDVNDAFMMYHRMPIPYVEPVDIANLAVFLLSDESRYITGQQIRVDAGAMVKMGVSFGVV